MSRRSVALVLALMAGMTLLLSSRCLGAMGAEFHASPECVSDLYGQRGEIRWATT